MGVGVRRMNGPADTSNTHRRWDQTRRNRKCVAPTSGAVRLRGLEMPEKNPVDDESDPLPWTLERQARHTRGSRQDSNKNVWVLVLALTVRPWTALAVALKRPQPLFSRVSPVGVLGQRR